VGCCVGWVPVGLVRRGCGGGWAVEGGVWGGGVLIYTLTNRFPMECPVSMRKDDRSGGLGYDRAVARRGGGSGGLRSNAAPWWTPI